MCEVQKLRDRVEAQKRVIAEVKADRADLELHIEAMEKELDDITDTLDTMEHELAELEEDLRETTEFYEDLAYEPSDVVLDEEAE